MILIRGKAALVGDSADIGVLAAVEGCRRSVDDGFMFEAGDDDVRLTNEPAGFEWRWTRVVCRLLGGSGPAGEGELLIL